MGEKNDRCDNGRNLPVFFFRAGSESERIRACFAESECELFVPDLDSDPDSVPDPVI
jgi:hypothetical protein